MEWGSDTTPSECSLTSMENNSPPNIPASVIKNGLVGLAGKQGQVIDSRDSNYQTSRLDICQCAALNVISADSTRVVSSLPGGDVEDGCEG